MSKVMQELEQELKKGSIPEFRVGDTLRIQVRVKEGEKERLQAFQGVVIAAHSGGNRSTVTVRKVSSGVGVERVFPLYAPSMGKIEVVKRSRVNRAKLYYLRGRRGKAARLREKRDLAEA
jgi:large subunit ribosomal protein L19